MSRRFIFQRLRAKVEVLRRSKGDVSVGEKLFKVSHPTLEVVDICPRYFSFGDGVESDAFHTRFLARCTRWEILVTAILSQSASIASRYIAKGGTCGGIGRDGGSTEGRVAGDQRWMGRVIVVFVGPGAFSADVHDN